MIHDDDRRRDPDLVDELLAARRDDVGFAVTREELDNGFAAIASRLDALDEQEAAALDELVLHTDLGYDAYTLGLEYLDRGELGSAAHWLRIAADHGVAAAGQQLRDVSELRDAVDTIDTRIGPTAPWPGAAPALSPDPNQAAWSPRTNARLADARAARQTISDAKMEAERIIAAAHQQADEILATARGAAAATTDNLRSPTEVATTTPGHHSGPQGLYLGSDRLHSAGYVPTLLLAYPKDAFIGQAKRVTECLELDRLLVDHSRLVRDVVRLVVATEACSTNFSRFLLSDAAVSRRRTGVSETGDTWRELRNAVGREAAEGLRMALHDGSAMPVRELAELAADSELVARFYEWSTHTRSRGLAAASHCLLDTAIGQTFRPLDRDDLARPPVPPVLVTP